MDINASPYINPRNSLYDKYDDNEWVCRKSIADWSVGLTVCVNFVWPREQLSGQRPVLRLRLGVGLILRPQTRPVVGAEAGAQIEASAQVSDKNPR